jgi:hypothetical protein
MLKPSETAMSSARSSLQVAILVETSDVAGLHPAIDDALGSRLLSSEISNSAKGSGMPQACGGCEPGTSLENRCRSPIIATGSSSVCPHP